MSEDEPTSEEQLKAELERVKHVRDVTEATLNAQLERATRARDVAAFNITELNDQRQQLVDTLEAALRLIEYLLGEVGAAGVVPSAACTIAKRALDDKIARLLKIEDKPRA
jgi:hypothetical protein